MGLGIPGLIEKLRNRKSLRLSKTFPGKVRRTADPSAAPDFLSRVAASVNYMWFSLGRTTYVVAGESGEAGNPSTLIMNRMYLADRNRAKGTA